MSQSDERRGMGEGSHSGSGTPWGMLTLTAMGKPMIMMNTIPLFAKFNRGAWISRLREDGVVGLWYEDVGSLEGDIAATPPVGVEEGFDEQYWKRHAEVNWVVCPLTGSFDTKYYTLNRYLGASSLLSSAMCAVADILSSESRQFVISSPQLFSNCATGFSGSYFMDKSVCKEYLRDISGKVEIFDNWYRCFMYLGGTTCVFPEDEGSETRTILYDRSYACVISNRTAMRTVSQLSTPCISMSAIIEESKWKHRLFPGDILVCDVKAPWLIELPISARVDAARVLSWLVFPRQEDEHFKSGYAIVPEIEEIKVLEDLVHANSSNVEHNAEKFYNEEMKNLQFDKTCIDSGDPFGEMERCRVTPNSFCFMSSEVEGDIVSVLMESESDENEDEPVADLGHEDGIVLDRNEGSVGSDPGFMPPIPGDEYEGTGNNHEVPDKDSEAIKSPENPSIPPETTDVGDSEVPPSSGKCNDDVTPSEGGGGEGAVKCSQQEDEKPLRGNEKGDEISTVSRESSSEDPVVRRSRRVPKRNVRYSSPAEKKDAEKMKAALRRTRRNAK